MSETTCKHSDIRRFDDLRCCLACGETVFEPSTPANSTQNGDTPGRYQYTTLNYKLGLEIRLVVLLPGKPADPICCEIIHVNLDDDPIYDAVSYTWATEYGDASLSKTVECVHGGVLAVTKNCEAALRQLRRLWYRPRLWIDAICIDQANLEEKNHQVGLMDRIYFSARSVRICIQDISCPKGFDNYSALFRRLKDVNSGSITAQDQFHEQSAPITRKLLRSKSSTNPWDVCMLIHLFSLRYFQRIWVLQEVAFAKAAYLMVNDQELFLTSSVLQHLTTACGNLPSSLSWRLNQQVESDIICCLRAGTTCRMTDPRDRVYAVLSLMESRFRSLIPVDYSSSIESVYAKAVMVIISTERNLNILSYAGVGAGWPTEWSTTMCLDGNRLDKYLSAAREPSILSHFPLSNQFEGETEGIWQSNVDVKIVSADYYEEACRHENTSCLVEIPQPTHRDYLPRLRVRAHYLDRVCQPNIENDIGGRPDKSRQDITGQMTHMLRDPRWLTHEYYTWMRPLFGGDCLYTIWDPDIRCSFLLQETWLEAAATPDVHVPETKLSDLRRFLKQADKYVEGYNFFSSHFSIGISRGGIQKGDEIFAVDGVRIPLILRRVGPQRYRIVSGCLLWAALQLDCWNPGTNQGRCGPGVKRPTDKQTQMIEIY